MDSEASNDFIPQQPKNSFRIKLELGKKEPRLDNVLINALRAQDENLTMKNLSRVNMKEKFNQGKILIKGQKARPSSSLAKGLTFVDIL